MLVLGVLHGDLNLNTLWNDHHEESSNHLFPYEVITNYWAHSLCYILHSCGLFYNWKSPGWTYECKTHKSLGVPRGTGCPSWTLRLVSTEPPAIYQLQLVDTWPTWPLVCMGVSTPVSCDYPCSSVFLILGVAVCPVT